MFSETVNLSTKNSLSDRCRKFHNLLVENRNLDYKSFIELAKEQLGDNIENEKNQYIKYTKRSISPSKSREMVTILKYMIAKSKGDIETVRNLKEEVDKIGIEREKNVGDIGSIRFTNQYIKRQKEQHENVVERVKKDVDLIIDSKKTLVELQKEKKIQSKSAVITKIKNNINVLGFDKYIEFLKVNFGLKTITEEDFNEFEYTIDFFLKNLVQNIDKFNKYRIPEDTAEILNLRVNGEENLSSEYKDNIRKLYAWKLKKMKVLVFKYQMLKDYIEDYKKNGINATELDYDSLQTIKNDEKFAYDFYRNVINVINTYNTQIKILNTVKDESRRQLEEKYMKEFLPKRNSK